MLPPVLMNQCCFAIDFLCFVESMEIFLNDTHNATSRLYETHAVLQEFAVIY